MDVVVTVPKTFGLQTWIDEGQLPGEPWNGEDYHFYLGGPLPAISAGERVYVIYNGTVRGYAPLTRIENYGGGRYALVRRDGAIAVKIPPEAQTSGFRGFRYRWWDYEDELPFPEWQIP